MPMERLDYAEFTISIPVIRGVQGWKGIEIRECKEPLVLLNERAPNLIAVDPQYYARDIDHASSNLYARRGVANRLVVAANLLPPDYKLLIWDAWRPLEVQQDLFDEHLNKLRQDNSGSSISQLKEMAQTYVSLPTDDPLKPSPHYTGGAVDLTIFGPAGSPIDMGTDFDHFGLEASARFYEEGHNSSEEVPIGKNRRLLYNIMADAGFSGYDEEWWHFDYGNQFDAARSLKKTAIYGGIQYNT